MKLTLLNLLMFVLIIFAMLGLSKEICGKYGDYCDNKTRCCGGFVCNYAFNKCGPKY